VPSTVRGQRITKACTPPGLFQQPVKAEHAKKLANLRYVIIARLVYFGAVVALFVHGILTDYGSVAISILVDRCPIDIRKLHYL
jgi:hypothetical protein